MIRDITIGQYYPADSVLQQNGSESKAGGYAGVHHLCLCIPYISGICSGNYISGSDDHSFQSSCEIYVQGTEGNRDASYDHSGI